MRKICISHARDANEIGARSNDAFLVSQHAIKMQSLDIVGRAFEGGFVFVLRFFEAPGRMPIPRPR